MWRIFSILIACAAVAAPLGAEPKPEIKVYKSPTCGCCEKWVEHLRTEGFAAVTHAAAAVLPITLENGVRPECSACHTAFVGGYVVEGHVPASDIRRLLAERPAVAGRAVPGMPGGAPRGEGPKPVAYEVLSFGAQGVRVFSKHTP